MQDKRFEKAIEAMFITEGGYNSIKNDYGGPTNLGITQTTFDRWRKMNNKPFDDIKNISRKEAKNIYYEMYWKASGADKQKDIRDAYILFDTAVQYGDVNAKKMFKEAGNDFYRLLEKRKIAYKDKVQKDPSQAIFLKGWLNRIENLKEKSEQLFKEEQNFSSYQEQMAPLSNSVLRQYSNTYKINDSDRLDNKIRYYLNKNRQTIDEYEQNYNANIKDIIFADEDISKLSANEFLDVEHIINNQIETGRFLSKSEAEAKVRAGEMIWVDEYIRGDGTKVKGHYRSKV